MNHQWRRGFGGSCLAAGVALLCSNLAGPVSAAEPYGSAAAPYGGQAYHAITPTASDKTITLTGHDLTVDQVVAVARGGAKVQLWREARQRSENAYGLLLEAAREGVPVYWFNRGAGANRETVIFSGDPLSPANKALLERRELATFQRGAHSGIGPEVDREAYVRAMMVVRANTMTYEAASPQLTQMLLDLLNHRITPVVQSRGSVGEGDLGPLGNVAATMVGAGECYYNGVRMPAAQALREAGLAPLKPFAADDAALTSSNAYASGEAALLVHDAREALDWADLAYAVDLNGMNSSITPLGAPVQMNRPFKWLNWDAKRVLEELRGSYLFNDDPKRIIQDPESLRASSIRDGAAWQAWGALNQDELMQINSSDHNPAVRVGLSPKDSWELNTPQFLKYYVKGGPDSHGMHGYITSDANWDPYPLANDLEAFTLAMANMDIAVSQRMQRFSSTFFTVIRPADVLPPGSPRGPRGGGGYASAALFQDLQANSNPIPPAGDALVQTVEDLQSESRLKVLHARAVTDDTMDLLAEDLLNGTFWLTVRKAQDGSRGFGGPIDRAYRAFDQAMQQAQGQPLPMHDAAVAFLESHPASEYYSGVALPAMP
jgi:histidine ammonia-lyase